MHTGDAIFSQTLKFLLFFPTLFSSAPSSRSRSRYCDAHAGAAASYSNHSLMHCSCALFKRMIQWLTQMYARVPLRPESKQDLSDEIIRFVTKEQAKFLPILKSRNDLLKILLCAQVHEVTSAESFQNECVKRKQCMIYLHEEMRKASSLLIFSAFHRYFAKSLLCLQYRLLILPGIACANLIFVLGKCFALH